MSTNSVVNVTLDQFMMYLKGLIEHIDEIPYNMQDEVMIGMMRLRYDGIYYKSEIELTGETGYMDIINSKEKRLEWKRNSAEHDRLRRERNETLIEQNDFIVKMYISKKQLGYQGELILDMQVPGNPFKHLKLYCPIKNGIEIDMEKRQLEVSARIQLGEENVLENPFDCVLYLSYQGPFKKIMIIEKEDCLVNYSVEDIMLDRLAINSAILEGSGVQEEIINMNLFKGVKLGEEKSVAQINNERINVLTDLKKTYRGKKPKETDAMKRQRRKSVTELVQLSGIKRIMEEGVKKINMCQTDGHVEINVPLEQENHTGNGVPTRGLAGIARLIKEGMKPAKEEKAMEIEPQEKPVQTVQPNQPVIQPNQVQPVVQNMANPVVRPIVRRQPRTQNMQNVLVQHLPMSNVPPVISRGNGIIIPRSFPPTIVDGVAVQNNPNAINPAMINPNAPYVMNPIVRPTRLYGYRTMNGYRMEQRPIDNNIMIIRAGRSVPYNPVITIKETERFEPVRTDIRQTDKEVERKRVMFDEIMQHIKNMKEGRGERKTYTIYLKNINSIFENEVDSIKLILKPQSIEFKKRDMYEKGVNHQESMTSKRLNIQLEPNEFYEEDKFRFGMYLVNGRVEVLLMIYSDGEVLTYKVNDIQVNEQSIN